MYVCVHTYIIQSQGIKVGPGQMGPGGAGGVGSGGDRDKKPAPTCCGGN